MWEFGTLPALDTAYLSSPEFQRLLIEAAQAQVPQELLYANPVAEAPQYLAAAPEAQPYVAPEPAFTVANAPEPAPAPLAVANAPAPVVQPYVASEPVAAREDYGSIGGYQAPIVEQPYVAPEAQPYVAPEPAFAVVNAPEPAPAPAFEVARTAPANETVQPLPPAQSAYEQSLAALSPEEQAIVQRGIEEAKNLDLSKISVGPIGGFDVGGGRSNLVNEADYLVSAPMSNKGNPTATFNKSSNQFFVYDNQPVRLIDNATGQIVFEGAGPADARKASELAAALTSQGGNKASWDIQTGPSGLDMSSYGTGQTTGWQTVAHEKKNKGVLSTIGDVVGTALPIAVGFIPGFGQLATGLQIAASAGAGAVGAGLRGDNILKGAVMGGLGSAGGEFVGGALKGAGIGANAAQAIGTGVGTTAGGLVTGQSLGDAALGGLTAGSLSYLGGELLKPGAKNTGAGGENVSSSVSGFDSPDIVVTGRGVPSFGGIGAVTPSFFDSAQTETAYQPPIVAAPALPAPDTFSPDITVTGSNLPAMPSFGGVASVAPGFFDSAQLEQLPQDYGTYADETPEIVATAQTGTPAVGGPYIPPFTSQPVYEAEPLEVTGKREAEQPMGGPYIPSPASQPVYEAEPLEVTGKREAEPTGNLSYIPSLVDDAAQAEMAGKTTPTEKSPLEKIRELGEYAQLAGYTLPLLEALLGGGKGGSGSGVRYPGAGTGTLNPTFSAKLPAPSLPGAMGNFAVRPQSDFGVANGQPRDWTKYGFGPEASFFGYVPKRGYAHGGEAHGNGPDRSFAVQGPGDGRSDEIPAVLSDGEYVIDAETVALLGNGSSKAGAEVLDQFRVNLRKHKGKKLAKGEFSVNAKRPEQYLAGGRI